MFDDPNTAAACLVYHAYKLNVELIGGHYDRDIVHDQKHWLKVAKLALANNMEPARFVNAQFIVLDDERKRAMSPRMLYTPVSKAISAYMATAPSPCNYRKVFDALAFSLQTLSSRRHVDIMTLIADPEQTYPPWFRILYPPVLTRELRDGYLEFAKSEISEDIHLQTFIKYEDKYGRFTDTDNNN